MAINKSQVPREHKPRVSIVCFQLNQRQALQNGGVLGTGFINKIWSCVGADLAPLDRHPDPCTIFCYTQCIIVVGLNLGLLVYMAVADKKPTETHRLEEPNKRLIIYYKMR